MNDVKRYRPPFMFSTQRPGGMEDRTDGDYVRYDDYAALRARLDAVEKERDEVKRSRLFYVDEHDKEYIRAERAEAALATARRDALLEVANMKPTREQIANAAMGYDHSFGLMTPAEQENLMHHAGWWLNAWQHVISALANEAETTGGNDE